MSLAEFVPTRHPKRRFVKERAVAVMFPDRRVSATPSALTGNRTTPVGRPATAEAGARRYDDAVFAETATAGLEALGVLEWRGREVAQDLRWRRVASARTGLLELIQGVQALVALATAAASARGDDFDLLSESDGCAASEVTRRAVHDLIARQGTEDWTALADGLERSFLPALRAWRAVFEAFIDPHDDPGPCGWAA